MNSKSFAARLPCQFPIATLLAVWLTLRTRALLTILAWGAVSMLVYLAAVLLLFLLLMAGKFVDVYNAVCSRCATRECGPAKSAAV